MILLFIITNMLHAVIYLYLTLKLVRYTQSNYQEEFAESTPFITLSWIRWVIYVLIITMVLRFITIFILEDFSGQNIVLLSILFVISILSYFSFQQPTLFENQPTFQSDEHKKEVVESAEIVDISTNDTSSNNTLSDDEKIALIERLETYMQTQQPFLNPKIRMPELAKALDIPRHIFSNLINEHYQVNFFHFINKYRVEYAQELLQNEAYANYTLEEIGNLSGFNSRSTFNRIFKNVTGKSPKEFQKLAK